MTYSYFDHIVDKYLSRKPANVLKCLPFKVDSPEVLRRLNGLPVVVFVGAIEYIDEITAECQCLLPNAVIVTPFTGTQDV